MGGTNKKLTTAVETYLDDLRRIRASGGATGERSSYGPLANLLNAVGATLKPKVFCVGELADQGAGHPDFGLYTAKQVQRGRPREGQAPERGVVAHLQVGLTMQDLDAPLADDGAERAGIFLTNALTGWEPRTTKPLPFPELEEERDRAERVKQETPILVILGNPPYNGFAGMAVDEERELSEAYRTTRRVRRPEGQGLNDLYVRFFRMAERRIAEKTGRGVVCFISNYSWLDGLSFTGMRERYLEAFDVVRVDLFAATEKCG